MDDEAVLVRAAGILKFLRSTKLAVGLIVFLAAASALASLVPQGQEKEFYRENYPVPAGEVILFLQFDSFFDSPLFLSGCLLFFVNLLLCTWKRFRSAHRKGSHRSWGPDLIHVGLLLLMAGGAVTGLGSAGRTEYLAEGGSITLPGGGSLTVASMKLFTYDDGRTRDWQISVEAGKTRLRPFVIEVNRPLRTNGVKIYLSTFFSTGMLSLVKGGRTVTLAPGRLLETDGGALYYSGVSRADGKNLGTFTGTVTDGSVGAVFEEWKDGVYLGDREIRVDDDIGGYRLKSIYVFPVAGLRVVRDPGYPLVVFSIALICLGLTLTLIRRIREEVRT